MFTWICPKCGAEVPPSENECPRCAKAQAAAPVAAPPAAPAPAAPAPPAAAAPPPQQTYLVPPPKQGLPNWAVVFVVALVLIAAGWAGIRFFQRSLQQAGQAETRPGARLMQPEAMKGAGHAHPFGKHLEIGGLRITEDARHRLQVRLVIINHSTAELPDIQLRVNLRPVDARPQQEPISTFTVKVPGLSAHESKDLSAEATTKLRAYEFPDWQFLKADFEVVSP
ncbi:MAG: zinc ribbon domain-containing protein [Acidobacteria bacterium]|nr:zinc ribbon domain-containing protein [Acidobacteriota bacterium]